MQPIIMKIIIGKIVILASSIGYSGRLLHPLLSRRPGFDPRGKQVDSAFHPIGLGKLRSS
jgi:hypothetical protein